jgi:hypothetical protein
MKLVEKEENQKQCWCEEEKKEKQMSIPDGNL